MASPASSVDLAPDRGGEGRAAAQPPLGLSLIQTSDTKPAPAEVEIGSAYLRATRTRTAILARANLLDIELREAGEDTRCAMLTATYRSADDWRARHVSGLNKCIREHLHRRGHEFRYVWCAELQNRGAVHFHHLLWLPAGVRLPYPDEQGWWPHGSTRIEWARSAVGYIAKYAGKVASAGTFPKGLRLTGAGGLSDHSRVHARYKLLPSYVREIWQPGTPIARAPGGGFLNIETGEIVRSPLEFVRRTRTGVVFRKRGEGLPSRSEGA